MTVRGGTPKRLNQSEMVPPFVQLIVVSAEGSTPREAGAAMFVDRQRTIGTIGGGQLEFEAIAHARNLLEGGAAGPWIRDLRSWSLGPGLGQCCGGAVRLLFEVYGAEEADELMALRQSAGAQGIAVHPMVSGEPLRVHTNRGAALELPLPIGGIVDDMLSGGRESKVMLVQQSGECPSYFIRPSRKPPTPLFIYGAGHVGEALVKAVSDLDFDIHWVDTHDERFPERDVGSARRVVAREPAIIAAAAPASAFHIVLTYSHAIDLAICRALLANSTFGFLGLIGSQTKRARFLRRLREGGIASAALSRLTCPIGIGGLGGKEPATIAISVAAQLISQLEQSTTTSQSIDEGQCDTVRSMRA